ncbi:MAG: hypothetical protein EBY39_11605 [Flavobacteriia bacterium]|nr:hypothetical protein [Flavobacteriia bacterium]
MNLVEKYLRKEGEHFKLPYAIELYERRKKSLLKKVKIVEKILGELKEKNEQSVVLSSGREINVGVLSDLSLEDLRLAYNALVFKGEREDLSRLLLDEIHYRERIEVWEEGVSEEDEDEFVVM